MLHKALIIKFLFLRLRVDFRDIRIHDKMAFLHFKKKGGPVPSDIDLDMPPEPPKMMEDEPMPEEPINEELMSIPPPKKAKAKKSKKEEIPELPPLPEEGDLGQLPELPSLPEEKGKELEEEIPELPDMEGELPPPPELKTKKQGFFSFLKTKKTAKDLELPKIDEVAPEIPPLAEDKGEELPEMPPLPEIEGKEDIKEFPEIPELPKDTGGEIPELPPLPEEAPTIPPIETIKAPELERPEPIPKIPEVPKEEAIEKPTKKFITIDEFREVQGSISNIKSTLKGIDDVFSKIEEAKINGDKEYVGLYNNLKDAQNKIMFVDRTLFKEEV